MTNGRAPYRADMVGSLLRPEKLKRARARRAENAIDADGLRAVEDECIRDAIAKQEEVGLKAVTDGEFRRSWWHYDFLGQLDGVGLVAGGQNLPFKGAQTKAEGLAVTGKIGFPADHPMLDHFRFLAANTSARAKMTVPSPSVLHFRLGREEISKVYPDLDEFFRDTAETYYQVVKAFYAAGCRYLQFDDTVWAYLCSQDQKEQARQRGDDPDSLPAAYARMINRALEARPDDMTITTHVCRGNFRSTWISEGGYEPVAETLLGGLNYDGFFLEYDTDRAGGFEPLRFLPKGDKRVVLGLITSKSGDLEAEDDVKRRIEEATRHADLDQFCLSPQCGFASTEEGNILTEEAQWKKLAFIARLAEEVWGGR